MLDWRPIPCGYNLQHCWWSPSEHKSSDAGLEARENLSVTGHEWESSLCILTAREDGGAMIFASGKYPETNPPVPAKKGAHKIEHHLNNCTIMEISR